MRQQSSSTGLSMPREFIDHQLFQSSHSDFRSALKTDALFFISFGLWLALRIIQHSNYSSMLDHLIPLSFIRNSSLALLLVHELMRGSRDRRSLVGAIVSIILAIEVFSIYDTRYFDGICFIFVARNISLDSLARFCLYEMSLICVAIVLTSLLGFAPGQEFIEVSRGTRFYLGFNHPNYPAIFLFFIFMLWAFLRGDHFGLLDSFCILAIAFWMYSRTFSRTSFILTVSFVFVYYLASHVPEGLFESRLVGILLVGSVCVATLVSLILAIRYDSGNDFLVKLDGLLSGRLNLAHTALTDLGVSPHGRAFLFSSEADGVMTTPYGVITTTTVILDNLYIRLLVHCGIIFSAVSIFLATVSMNALYQNRQFRVLIIVAFLAAFGLSERCAAYLSFNPFLFLLALPLSPQSSKLSKEPQRRASDEGLID